MQTVYLNSSLVAVLCGVMKCGHLIAVDGVHFCLFLDETLHGQSSASCCTEVEAYSYDRVRPPDSRQHQRRHMLQIFGIDIRTTFDDHLSVSQIQRRLRTAEHTYVYNGSVITVGRDEKSGPSIGIGLFDACPVFEKDLQEWPSSFCSLETETASPLRDEQSHGALRSE